MNKRRGKKRRRGGSEIVLLWFNIELSPHKLEYPRITRDDSSARTRAVVARASVA